MPSVCVVQMFVCSCMPSILYEEEQRKQNKPICFYHMLKRQHAFICNKQKMPVLHRRDTIFLGIQRLSINNVLWTEGTKVEMSGHNAQQHGENQP